MSDSEEFQSADEGDLTGSTSSKSAVTAPTVTNPSSQHTSSKSKPEVETRIETEEILTKSESSSRQQTSNTASSPHTKQTHLEKSPVKEKNSKRQKGKKQKGKTAKKIAEDPPVKISTEETTSEGNTNEKADTLSDIKDDTEVEDITSSNLEIPVENPGLDKPEPLSLDTVEQPPDLPLTGEQATQDTGPSGDISEKQSDTAALFDADDGKYKKPTGKESPVNTESADAGETNPDNTESVVSKDTPVVETEDNHRNVLEKLSAAGDKVSAGGSGWGWGGGWSSWGTSIINSAATAAATSINTLTDQVSEGMSTVVESFESTIGAPAADKLASEISEFVKEPEEPILSEENPENKEADKDWLTGVTGNLQNSTKSLMSTGLGVLETIGKKTMDTIKDQDPGFKKTRTLLTGKPATTLSEMLKEAKEENESNRSTGSENQMANLSVFFDQYSGLVHLESLEMLSIASVEKLSNTGEDNSDIHEVNEILDEINELFSIVNIADDDEITEQDYATGVDNFIKDLEVDLPIKKLKMSSSNTADWLTRCQQQQDDGEQKEGMDIHRQALSSFAELTAFVIEVFRKSAELLLLKCETAEELNVKIITEAFIKLLHISCSEIHIQSNQYNTCLNTAADDSEDPDSINPLITSVFLEATNSCSYMSDAFTLLKPVIQHIHVKHVVKKAGVC